MPPKSRGRGGKSFFKGRQQQQSHQHGADKPAEYKPREKYPATSTPKMVGLRRAERAQIAHFRRLRKTFQDGPLYTVLDQPGLGAAGTTATAATTGMAGMSMRIAGMPGLRGTAPYGIGSGTGAQQGSNNSARDIDPFEALPTFSQKFKKPRRPVPQLQGGQYIKAFFPVELHQYIDSSAGGSGGTAETQRAMTLLGAKARAKLTAAEEEELELELGLQQEQDEEEEEVLMEEEDDDFEEDEDDDDDYNAENYFSDGKSDAGGDDGGGGDDY